jgi:type II secretory pathway pseudopilin PulG
MKRILNLVPSPPRRRRGSGRGGERFTAVSLRLSGARQPPECGVFVNGKHDQGADTPRSRNLTYATYRAAYSLIELVTVIAMISIVMSSSTLLFVTMLRSERNTSVAVVEQQTLARLATQFRRDVHQAKSAALTAAGDGSPELTLIAGTSEPIRYRIAGDRVERMAPVADGLHRESYRIRHAAWEFVPPAEGSKILSLELKLSSDPGQPRSESAAILEKVWRIDAGLGLTLLLGSNGGTP